MKGYVDTTTNKPYFGEQYCGYYEDYRAPFGLYIIEQLKGGSLVLSDGTYNSKIEVPLNNYILQDAVTKEILVISSLIPYREIEVDVIENYIKSYNQIQKDELINSKKNKKKNKSEVSEDIETTEEVVEPISDYDTGAVVV